MALHDDISGMLPTKGNAPASSASDRNGVLSYDDALQDAIRQCLLIGDYDRAVSRWFTVSRLARMMGVPDRVVQKYENELLALLSKGSHIDGLLPHTSATDAAAVAADRLTRAVEACASNFWGNSSWAVVFCICRDCCGYQGTMADFERLVATLPLRRPQFYECPAGTIQKTLSNNPYMQQPVTKWQQLGAKERVLLLASLLEDQLGQS